MVLSQMRPPPRSRIVTSAILSLLYLRTLVLPTCRSANITTSTTAGAVGEQLDMLVPAATSGPHPVPRCSFVLDPWFPRAAEELPDHQGRTETDPLIDDSESSRFYEEEFRVTSEDADILRMDRTVFGAEIVPADGVVQGVMISEILPGGWADLHGLEVGDVIPEDAPVIPGVEDSEQEAADAGVAAEDDVVAATRRTGFFLLRSNLDDDRQQLLDHSLLVNPLGDSELGTCFQNLHFSRRRVATLLGPFRSGDAGTTIREAAGGGRGRETIAEAISDFLDWWHNSFEVGDFHSESGPSYSTLLEARKRRTSSAFWRRRKLGLTDSSSEGAKLGLKATSRGRTARVRARRDLFARVRSWEQLRKEVFKKYFCEVFPKEIHKKLNNLRQSAKIRGGRFLSRRFHAPAPGAASVSDLFTGGLFGQGSLGKWRKFYVVGAMGVVLCSCILLCHACCYAFCHAVLRLLSLRRYFAM